jgi:hypothetical protein
MLIRSRGCFNDRHGEFVQGVVNESVKVPVHVWREVVAKLLAHEAEAQLKKIRHRR